MSKDDQIHPLVIIHHLSQFWLRQHLQWLLSAPIFNMVLQLNKHFTMMSCKNHKILAALAFQMFQMQRTFDMQLQS